MSIKISGCFKMQPEWNIMWTELVFTPVWNIKPLWVHFAFMWTWIRTMNIYRESQNVSAASNKITKIYENMKIVRNENQFSSFIRISVEMYSNWLIGWIVISRAYRPWNDANTTTNIYLLVENGNQNTETKCKVCSNLLSSVLGQLTVVLLP